MEQTWNEFIRRLMAEKDINQIDVAEALNKTQGTVGHWLTGRRNPNFEEVAKILKVIGTDRVILNSDGTLSDIEYIGKPKNGVVKVVGEATMGADGSIDVEEFPIGYIKIFSSDPNAFCLKVKGSSMEPRIYSGEFVLVEPSTPINNGDDVFIRTFDGRNMIKILDHQKDGEYRFSSINHDHKPFNIPINDVEKIFSVAGILKKSRFIDLDEIDDLQNLDE